MGPHVVDGEDVRVVQGAGGAGLLLEAAELLAIGDLLGENLDRHLALQARVTGAVDLTHRPRAEQPHDLVRAESRACLERHRYTPALRAFSLRRTDLPVGGDKYSRQGDPRRRGPVAGRRTPLARQRAAALRRKIHAAQEVLEAGVRAQGIEGRIDFQGAQPLIAHFVGFLQPFEGLIFFTQPRVNECDSIRLDRLDIRSLLQLSNALPSFSHTARSGIGISQVSQCSGIAGVLFQALSELGNGFFIHPFLPVDPPEEVVIAQFGLELTLPPFRP